MIAPPLTARESAIRRQGEPCSGPRLPFLPLEGDFAHVGVNVIQLAGLAGEVTLVNPVTFENIAAAGLAEGPATHSEIDRMLDALYAWRPMPRPHRRARSSTTQATP